MENPAERRTAMIAQAQEILAGIREREAMAREATAYVTATLALGLREQGLTDKAIGDVLSVSRNRVSDMVKASIWPFACGDKALADRPHRKFVQDAIEDVYRPIAQPNAGWVHTKTDCSGHIAVANNIALPPQFEGHPSGLDPDAAQFDNLDTGERVVVYTLERHNGRPLFDSGMRLVGFDFMGAYRVELCGARGDHQPLPLEHLGISESDMRFGAKWPNPAERRDSGDAFRNAMSSVRRHYGIWPRPALIDWKIM